MDKFQRRQLFAQRVEQEERAKREQMWHQEQERERQKQLSILQEQQQQQQMQPPHILMDANGVPCFFDAATNSWHAYHAPPGTQHSVSFSYLLEEGKKINFFSFHSAIS
jgi:hypothetical protein